MDLNQINQFLGNPYFAIPFLLWNLFWKGFALWTAGNKKQLPWFVILMIVNTMGILEIAYIFYLKKFDLDNGRLLKFIESKFSKKK